MPQAMPSTDFDVLVAGGGPGGATLATLLARQGRKVAVFEKQSFPRFQIGESLLPYSMPALRESGAFERIQSLGYLPKFGAQFLDYRLDKEVFFDFEDGLDPDECQAFEVPRDRFDQDLLDYAVEQGVQHFEGEAVLGFSEQTTSLMVRTEQREVQTKFLVDATGRSALIGTQLGIRRPRKNLNHIAVFSHYESIPRKIGKREGDILIGVLPGSAWSWTIPFQGGRTSFGVVCHVDEFQGSPEEHLTRQIQSCALLQESMENATRVGPIRTVSGYSHDSTQYFGNRWVMLGDAATFLDPIFSSGVHVSVQSAQFAAHHLQQLLAGVEDWETSGRGREYESMIRKGVQRFHSMIELFYKKEFVSQMLKVKDRDHLRRAFTSVVAGDVWNDQNPLFEKGILG